MLTMKKIAQNNVTTGAGAGLGLWSQLYISVRGLQSLVFVCTIVIIQPSCSCSYIKVSFLIKHIFKKFKKSSSTAIWAKWTGGSSNCEQGGNCQLSRWAGGHPIIKMCLRLFDVLVFLFVWNICNRDGGEDVLHKRKGCNFWNVDMYNSNIDRAVSDRQALGPQEELSLKVRQV